jgi:L-fucose isomerase-like protein
MPEGGRRAAPEGRRVMSIVDRPVCFGVIVGTRGLFNPALASEGRKKLLGVLDAMGFTHVIPDERATPHGAIESLADARRCAALFRAKRADIEGIIVSLPNFGDELGVVQALDLAALGVPVLVHAFDDDIDKVDVAHRRDAFCGKLSVCKTSANTGSRGRTLRSTVARLAGRSSKGMWRGSPGCVGSWEV